MLWDFGYRHHPELQTKWIDGAAGLATIANIVDEKPQRDAFERMAEEFLADTNPKVLEALRKAPKEERARLTADLEKNYAALGELLKRLKDI